MVLILHTCTALSLLRATVKVLSSHCDFLQDEDLILKERLESVSVMENGGKESMGFTVEPFVSDHNCMSVKVVA